MDKQPTDADEKHEDAVAAPAPEQKPHCGIIMPISESTEFPGHWAQVRTLIERAAERAGFTASMVSENDGEDMIHASIIKNIYHNPVVVCDVSSLNPNVMLELGLRMATKKPLVLVFDSTDNYPFDIKNFIYAQYPKGLHFFTIEKFVTDLADKIKQVFEAERKGTYKPYLSHFSDLVIEPSKLDINTQNVSDTLVGLVNEVKSLKADLKSSKTTRYSLDTNVLTTNATHGITTREFVLIKAAVRDAYNRSEVGATKNEIILKAMQEVERNFRSISSSDNQQEASDRFAKLYTVIRDSIITAADSYNVSDS